nr:hypothetical protein [Bacteroidota bacterium]
MIKRYKTDTIGMSIKSYRLMQQLLGENPKLREIFTHAKDHDEALENLKVWALDYLQDQTIAKNYYCEKDNSREAFENLRWRDKAAIRILDYIDHTGRLFEDLNLQGRYIKNQPFDPLWHAMKNGKGGGTESYFSDMIHLFRQFNGQSRQNAPDTETVMSWMDRHPSGLEREICHIREVNKVRILKIIIKRIESGEVTSKRYYFDQGMSQDEKYNLALQWWDTYHFHLKFAIRTPELLNEMLGYSLDLHTLELMEKARRKGIPFFVNPYYLSLLNVDVPGFAIGADLAIRDYVFVSEELIDEFGDIVAWEKEDMVEPGKPNAAGWILPSDHNLHRRYPEVSILIPDTAGRACGGLCVSCQRMYDFQSGHLNFDLLKLQPIESWHHKLIKLLRYFENDTQLRDILITGGDGLMSSNLSIKLILDEVYEMALRKKQANESRPEGEKYAEMLRVRLGTRLPVYIPQRITDKLRDILAEFKAKASKIGFRQFVIQTHFESAMEITPEAKVAVEKLLSAGWIVTNQQVFTTAASRRGHTAKLRQELNRIGVLTYYTFSV